MNSELVFNSKEELEATERVLATFKSEKINESIDQLLAEIYKYATHADELLESIGKPRVYIDEVSNLNEKSEIKVVDVDDSKLKEDLEDIVKRINTRIALIKESDKNYKELLKKYKLEDCNLLEELKKADLM